jgi:thioredoxin
MPFESIFMKLFQLKLIVLLVAGLSACQHLSNGIQTVNADDFEKALKQNPGANLVDVRTPDEYQGGHIPGAVNIDYQNPNFVERVSKLDKTKPVFVYCLSGGRSAGAAEQLRDAGFKQVYNLQGGFLQWNAAGKPKEPNGGSMSSNRRPPSTAPVYSSAEFKKLTSTGDYVLVDFSAVWCGPCKKIAPMLDALAEQKKDKLTLLKVDVDANKQLAVEKNISRIPYLELYNHGKLVWSREGMIDEETLLAETKL